MNEPSEEVKAMARRIAREFAAYNDTAVGCAIAAIAEKCALAAILETRTEIIRSLRHDFDDWPDYVALSDVADALEDGTHYGKAEQ